MNTIIVTDSCADLPLPFVREHELPVISLSFIMSGQEYPDDFGQSMDYQRFYDIVRKGEMPTTSQINTQQFIDFFRPFLQQGKDILYIAFSSALSGTCNSAMIAREMLKDEFPERSIMVVDSLSASMGQGLLVYYALKMQEKGSAGTEIYQWLEENKLKLNHWFTVEDLNHLKRGGRVSGAAAFIGTILDIKPVLHVSNEGKLVPVEKVKGRKKSLRVLAEKLEQRITNPEEQMILISHGDSLEDAEFLKSLIESKVKVKGFMINHVGPVIGSHSGPGTIALFFIANER